MAPLGVSVVAAFIGTRVGLYHGIDVLNAKASLDRQGAAHEAQQQVLDGQAPVATEPETKRFSQRRFSHRERERE